MSVRDVRFGRDQAELTTKAYASAVALFLRWCGRTGRDWRAAAGDLSLFITWLRFAPRELTGAEAAAAGTALVLAGPGAEPVRGPARIAGVLVGVRAFLCHAVKTGAAPADLLPLLARAGLRRGEAAGLRRSDMHFMPGSAALGCALQGAHVHVVRRLNANGARARSVRQRWVPADGLVVRAYDQYVMERLALPHGDLSDFVLVNLLRGGSASRCRRTRRRSCSGGSVTGPACRAR